MPPSILLHFTRADRASESFAFQPGPARYQAHRPGGGVAEVLLDWDAELLDLLAAIATPRPDPGALSRVGERLRPLVADSPLTPVEAALAAGQPARITVRSAAAELYALPWELLSLGPSGLWLGQLDGVQLSLEWPETCTQPATSQGEGAVLLAWSDAGGPVPWTEHRDAIAAASGEQGWFRPDHDVLSQASRATIAEKLRTAAATGRPYTALHLLCHGAATPDGGALVLHPHGPGAGVERLDGAALRGLLLPYLGQLRLVTLMACSAGAYGQPGTSLGGAALALHRAGAEVVIATRQPLAIDASILASEALYHGLLQEVSSVQGALAAARRVLIDRSISSAWASLQLFAREADGADCRPFTLRPYRGLLAFEHEDARFFFGREREQLTLLDRLLTTTRGDLPRFQLLCGATGSGKTSLLRAAVLPALQRLGWRVGFIRPTVSGVAEIAALRSGLEAEQHLLLVVDPLQDLFLAQADGAERDAVAGALWSASLDPSVVVLACLRVDYLGRCEEIALDAAGRRLDAVAYDEAHRFFLPAATPAQLRQAIEGPAERVGLRFQPGLVELLLEDAGQEAGALPALQHALDQLWTRREGRLLTHAAYRALGGLAGALARTADDLLDRLSDEARALARRLLVSLVSEGPDGALAGRRSVALSELRPSEALQQRAFDGILEALVQGRLLTMGGGDGTEPVVEIAHEALLRRWETLRAWYAADRDLHRRLDEIRRLAEAWAAHPGERGWLIDGNRLAYALELAREHGQGLPGGVAPFLRACQEAEGAAAASARAQADRIHDAAILATARAARGLDPTRAALLLREVRGVDQPAGWLQEAMDVLSLPLCTREGPAEAEASPERPSPTGRGSARIAEGGAVQVWIHEGAREITLRGRHVGAVLDVAWSPDGQTLATAGEDQCVFLWSLPEGSDTQSLRESTGPVRAVAFDPTGRRLLGACQDGRARIWEQQNARWRLRADINLGAPLTAACWLDAERFVVGTAAGGLIVQRPSGEGQIALSGHHAPVCALECGDGGALRSRSVGGHQRTWRLAPPPVVGPPVSRRISEGRLVVMAWSPTGEALALAAGEEAPVLWRPDGEGPPTPLSAHRGTARALAWSPTGDRLLTGSTDGVSRLWDAASGALVGELRGHDLQLRAVQWSSDGARIATLDADGEVRLWGGDGAPLGVIADADADLSRIAFSPDGARLLGWRADRLCVWSMLQAGREERWPQPAGPLKAARWRPDSGALGVALADGALALISLQDSRALGRLDGALPRPAEWAMAWRPDGEALALGDGAGGVTLWAADGAGRTWSGRCGLGPVLHLEFDPSGRRLLGRAAGGLVVFDGAAPDEALTLRSAGVGLTGAAFDPRRARVAATGEDGQVRLWPVDTAGLLTLLRAATACSLSESDQEIYRGTGRPRGLWGAGLAIRPAAQR